MLFGLPNLAEKELEHLVKTAMKSPEVDFIIAKVLSHPSLERLIDRLADKIVAGVLEGEIETERVWP